MTLRKTPGDKEKRGAVLTDDIPVGFKSAVVDRPMSSVEVIRKPKLLNPLSMNTWKATPTNAMTTTSRFSERSGKDYFESKMLKNQLMLSQVKAGGDGIEDLIVMNIFNYFILTVNLCL